LSYACEKLGALLLLVIEIGKNRLYAVVVSNVHNKVDGEVFGHRLDQKLH
jgi:hypothetical protein